MGVTFSWRGETQAPFIGGELEIPLIEDDGIPIFEEKDSIS